MNKLVMILLGATALFGSTTLHLVRELREEREHARELQSRVAELERVQAAPVTTEVVTTAQPVAESPQPSAAAMTAGTPPAAQRPALASNAASMPAAISALGANRDDHLRMMRESHERRRALLADPKYRDAMIAQHRYMSQRMYPDLGEALDLDAEEAERLLTLLAEQQVRMQEGSPGPFAGDDPNDVRAMIQKQQEMMSANQAELAALLGPQRMQEWQDYQQSLGIRQNASALRATFASRGVPLDAQQHAEMLDVLLAEHKRTLADWQARSAKNPANAHNSLAAAGMFGPVAIGPGNADPLARLNDQAAQLERTRESLRSVLSAEQLRVLEQEHEQQIRMQQLQLQMMQAEREVNGGAAQSTNGIVLQSSGVFVQP